MSRPASMTSMAFGDSAYSVPGIVPVSTNSTSADMTPDVMSAIKHTIAMILATMMVRFTGLLE